MSSSRQPLSKQLSDTLNIIADLSNNNTNVSIKDVDIIDESKNIPENEVRNYLDQLESRGLIMAEVKVAGASFRHYRITREGITSLTNKT